jgi:amino acid adenylation domain-containing protein
MKNDTMSFAGFSLKERDHRPHKLDGTDEQIAQPNGNEVASFPLSFAQQRLWFVDQLVPDSSIYTVPLALRLTGKLDGEALEQSVNEVIRRHQILRTFFKVEGAQPVQKVTPALQIHLTRVDLQALPEAEQEVRVHEIAAQEAQRAFDLAQCPLLRASLLRLSEEKHVLLVIMHHILSDSWSARVFIRELTSLYQSITSQSTPLLPDLPLQYTDVAIRQREWMQSEEAQSQLHYWKKQLAGISPMLQVPVDRPRPPVQSFQAAYYPFQLSGVLTEALKTLSQRENVTLFMTLLAAVNALLFRYTRQEDVIVGTPVANRTRTELEGLIGFFENTLVLRTDLSGDPRFIDVLVRIREVVLEATAHHAFPFERLVEELRPKGDLSYNSLFQVMVAMQDAPMEPVALPDILLAPLQIESNATPFDLAFEFSEAPEGLGGRLTYSTDLFDATTMARLVGHLQVLLEGIVAQPEQRIAQLPLLTEAERRQMLVEWNETRRDYPPESGVHQLFEAQVKRTPEAIAVTDEQGQLTYHELNQQANQLARHLRALGVGPEVLVGICLDRTAHMLVGLLAIFKAGGAYVPLDPDFPAERLAYMLEDAQIQVLLTQDSLRALLPISEQFQVVCLESDGQQIAQQSSANLNMPVDPDQLAYVLYTSGSTGKPKGVGIPQRALVNFLCSMQQVPGISAEDTLLAVTTLSFDIAGLELYLPLLVGARVALSSRATATNGQALAHALEQVGATMLQGTPATWRLLLSAGWPGKADLVALCGGEALPRDLAEHLLPRVKALFNMYGPTETTIWSTLCQIRSVEIPISIGHPIANTQVYVLDHDLQPVPIGVPGELYIGGDGVARGYLHRPDLTQERFLPDPFSTTHTASSARIYRTGDLARYLSDGSLEHLGRLDHQVKVSGFRIELGEIEVALSQHPSVKACVAVAQEAAGGEKRLAAYVVAENETAPSMSDLHRFLAEQLPYYMLPSDFVLLDAFPLTPNGKIDRKTLPMPDRTDGRRDSALAAPSTPTEQRLVEIVASLLGVEQVGIDENFFLIGGNSLTGMQLTTQVDEIFGIHLPLRTLFDAPTVRQLAAEIERLILVQLQTMSDDEAQSLLEEDHAHVRVLAIQTGGSRRPFFYLHGAWVEGWSFHCYPLAQALGPDQPFYGMDPYLLDGQQGLPTMEDIAAAHIKKMRTIQPEGPYLLGGYCNGALVAYEMARQLQAAGHTVDLLFLMDAEFLKYPISFRGYRAAFNLLGRVLRLSQEKQLTWYLRLKHLWRSLRQTLLRKEDPEHLAFADLHQNYPRLFDWIGSGYTPSSLYAGKITFFWTEGENDVVARASHKSWRKVEANGNADIHHLPGHYMTSRTVHLHVMAECLESCIRKAQLSASTED